MGSYFGTIGNKNVLLPCTGLEEKTYMIQKAATAGQATFATAELGRGTDFFCNDLKLKENGGVHIIQAFFAADKTEEIQIQGRAARQGAPGSYSLVLLEKELTARLGIARGAAQRM